MGPTSPMRRAALAILASWSLTASAYDLDIQSSDSIKTTAKQMATDLLSFYKGDKPGGTPGLLPEPYYWWEAGAMLGALVDYWYYTDDSTFVDLTKQGLLNQVGEQNDYMTANQTLTEGNDDQGFWGLAVMSAAENNFPNPGPDEPQWLALAQAVFNTQAARWDPDHCGGGLRWQIFSWNKGYDYKNSISQACFFALGARLALYTGNDTYADWAMRTWDWMEAVEFIDENWYVYDGAHIPTNCTNIQPWQFTYNAGGFILGAAAMYNYTEDPLWKNRLDGLIGGAKVFFTGPEENIMTEVACEPVNRCNIDQQSFKAYLSRWLAATVSWAPHTKDTVMPLLQASAVAAAKQCTGGANGRMCGMKWNTGKYDGTTGVGQQMAALEVTLSCMVEDRAPPLTESTGGTSKGDPGAGGSDTGKIVALPDMPPLGGANAAGGAIITIAIAASVFAAVAWMLMDETSDQNILQQISGFRSSASAEIAAFAAGGAGGATLHKRRNSKEKSQGVEVDNTELSSQNSENQAPAGIKKPMAVSRVRDVNPTARHSRRLSNMPLGWPNNTSVRSSGLPGPDYSGQSLGNQSISNQRPVSPVHRLG